MNIKQLAASAVETVIKIAVVIFLVSFVYDTAVKAYDYGYRVFAEEPVSTGDGRTISIAVEPDDSVRDIGKNLEEKGLIRDANLFFVQELLSEYHGKIQPGIYDLNTSMKSDEMLEIMSAEPEEEENESGASANNGSAGETDNDDAQDAEGAGDGADTPEGEETDGDGTEGNEGGDGAPAGNEGGEG